MSTYDDWKTTPDYESEPEGAYCEACCRHWEGYCGCPCCHEGERARRARGGGAMMKRDVLIVGVSVVAGYACMTWGGLPAMVGMVAGMGLCAFVRLL